MSLSPPASSLTERLAAVQQRITAATERAGRAPGSVTLVAVSKTHDAAAVQQVIDRGQHSFGENRVQEAAGKFPALRATDPALELHLIGALQTNKARDAVRIADVIESVDRSRLIDAIAAAIQSEGRSPRLLIQVNVGDEPQKAGVSRAEADHLIDVAQERFGAGLAGLMCIPPADQDPGSHFAWLAECARRHGLTTLSMGMSGDYESAIQHGATHVRVGSAIFGVRPTPV